MVGLFRKKMSYSEQQKLLHLELKIMKTSIKEELLKQLGQTIDKYFEQERKSTEAFRNHVKEHNDLIDRGFTSLSDLTKVLLEKLNK